MLVSELKGIQLDWAVLHALGFVRAGADDLASDLPRGVYTTSGFADSEGRDCWAAVYVADRIWAPSTSHSDAGPLIERFCITVSCVAPGDWVSYRTETLFDDDFAHHYQAGKTWTEAAMRTLVAIQLGPEVQLPEELG